MFLTQSKHVLYCIIRVIWAWFSFIKYGIISFMGWLWCYYFIVSLWYKGLTEVFILVVLGLLWLLKVGCLHQLVFKISLDINLYLRLVWICDCSNQFSHFSAPSSCVSTFFEGCTRGMINILSPFSCTTNLTLVVKYCILQNMM